MNKSATPATGEKMDINDVGTLADENRFNFQKHQMREGVIDKQGRTKLTPEQKFAMSNSHRCDTVAMFKTSKTARADLPETIAVNAHAMDDQGHWRALGYQTQADIDAPLRATEERIRQAADLVAAVKTIQGETSKTKRE